LPEKIEHIVQCNLSRRQRLLYDEYINLDKTRNILADSDFFSIMSVLMQLRKVCNHPDLFEARSIESPFILTDQDRITYSFPTWMLKELHTLNSEHDVNLSNMNLKIIDLEDKRKLVAMRQAELLPNRQLHQAILDNKHLIGPNSSRDISQNLLMCRPFQDGIAVGPMSHTNNHSLHKPNCGKLLQTIPSIMPYDIGSNYKMQFHQLPTYLKPACLPFSQQYFSSNYYNEQRYSSYDEGRFNPIAQFQSAL
jgi:hypothetical protein